MTTCKRYEELVKGDKDAVANFAWVYAGDYFVEVVTDDYEGSAAFHVSVAKKLRAVLGRAIKHVEEQQKAQKLRAKSGKVSRQ